MKIKLFRAPMSAKIEDAYVLDTTVKSATEGRFLATTWDMVMSHKKNNISHLQYTERQLDLLSIVPKHKFQDLYDKIISLPQYNNTLCLKCFCPDGKFCHTCVAIVYMVNRWSKAFQYSIDSLEGLYKAQIGAESFELIVSTVSQIKAKK